MLEAMFDRMRRARSDFAETLMRLGAVDQATADRLTDFYLKKKLAKMDTGIGRISVKHGAYLDRDVIGRAADMMNGKVE